jgi:hypothetical protein
MNAVRRGVENAWKETANKGQAQITTSPKSTPFHASDLGETQRSNTLLAIGRLTVAKRARSNPKPKLARKRCGESSHWIMGPSGNKPERKWFRTSGAGVLLKDMIAGGTRNANSATPEEQTSRTRYLSASAADPRLSARCSSVLKVYLSISKKDGDELLVRLTSLVSATTLRCRTDHAGVCSACSFQQLQSWLSA